MANYLSANGIDEFITASLDGQFPYEFFMGGMPVNIYDLAPVGVDPRVYPFANYRYNSLEYHKRAITGDGPYDCIGCKKLPHPNCP